jgi:hypothetical protein
MEAPTAFGLYSRFYRDDDTRERVRRASIVTPSYSVILQSPDIALAEAITSAGVWESFLI